MAVTLMQGGFSRLDHVRHQIEVMMSATIAASKIRKITIHQRDEDNQPTTFQLDKGIVTILFAPPGYTKTTAFKKIALNYGPRAFLVNRYTKASFEGTIENGRFIPPSIWMKDLIMLDETCWEHLGGSAATLLTLADGGFIDKHIARGVMVPIKLRDRKDKRAKLTVEGGHIHMDKVTSMIFGSMYDYMPKNLSMQALFTRSISIWIPPSKKLLFEIARGKVLYKYKDLPVQQEYDVNEEDNEFIVSYVEKKFTSPDLYWADPEGSIALRTIADLTILFCIFGKAKEHPIDLYDFVMHQKRRMMQVLFSSEEARKKVVPWDEVYMGFGNNSN